MRHWIEALLDPAPIEKGNKDKVNVQIQMPPRFDLENASPVILPPYTSVRATRARSTRSASPSKLATPSRKLATPRKPRTTRSAAKPELLKAEEIFESVKTAVTPSTAMQNIIANGITFDEPTAPVNGEMKEPEVAPAPEAETNGADVKEGTVRIEVRETVETKDNVETTTTNVKIDVPHNHAELPEPEDPAKMIEEAKRMVAEAKALEAESSSGIVKTSKRRIEDVLDTEELAAENSSTKKAAYTTEQKLTKEKVTRRALVGVGIMAAIG